MCPMTWPTGRRRSEPTNCFSEFFMVDCSFGLLGEASSLTVKPAALPSCRCGAKFIWPFGSPTHQPENGRCGTKCGGRAGHPQNPLYTGNFVRQPKLTGRRVRKLQSTPLTFASARLARGSWRHLGAARRRVRFPSLSSTFADDGGHYAARRRPAALQSDRQAGWRAARAPAVASSSGFVPGSRVCVKRR